MIKTGDINFSEVSESELGTFGGKRDTLESADHIHIDGMDVPHHVYNMIIEAGYNPKLFKRDELHQILIAANDGRLVEDHEGEDLIDKLTLTIDEILERRKKKHGPQVEAERDALSPVQKN